MVLEESAAQCETTEEYTELSDSPGSDSQFMNENLQHLQYKPSAETPKATQYRNDLKSFEEKIQMPETIKWPWKGILPQKTQMIEE